MKIPYDGDCKSKTCSYRSTCANHTTAGDFRMDDGFTPELYNVGEDVYCRTIERPVAEPSVFTNYPDNYDRLDRGYLAKIPADNHSVDLSEIAVLAAKAHSGQFRKDGITPYIVHPIEVMQLLRQWGVEDAALLAAALCHDILEDASDHCGIEYTLPQRAYSIVEEMTRPADMDKDLYRASFQGKSLGAVLLKVADLIRNTQDFLRHKKASGQRYWAAGNPIIAAYLDKSQLIVEKFGNKVNDNVQRDIEAVNDLCR